MTAVAIARVPERVPRTACLGELCPELADTESAPASIELLLSHRAGLAGHVPIFHPLALGETLDPLVALRIAANARREDTHGDIPSDGFMPVYSDLGYALAGVALARHVGTRDAGEAVLRLVIEPLLLSGQLGTARDLAAHGVSVVERAAPTEEVLWRGGLVQGRVHDENAWALTAEGGSGHAGMFGTVAGVLHFGEAVLDGLSGRGPFGADDLSWLVAPRPGGTLRAGFDGKSPHGSSAGALFGPRSFGHLGFTGTSVWIDPDAQVVAALLTNRVHPLRTRAEDAIKRARPLAHEALYAYAVAKADGS
jgi:CubicO group peptidase (beta-lactamase class C family)